MSKPFEIAERYIQLRKHCLPESWGDTVIRFNEMVVGPIIAIFFLLVRELDLFMILSTAMTAYRTWSDWEEFHILRGKVQEMRLIMNLHGGPCIRTNDPDYMPYVYADAMVRLSEHHRRPWESLLHATDTLQQEQSRP
jgi:hypothetical protein